MANKKTHCIRGHDFSKTAYYYTNPKTGKTRRFCRKCRNIVKKKQGRLHLTPAMREFRWRKIKIRDKGTCRYCGEVTENGQLDHVEPHSNGGADDVTNMVWSCPTCNQTKSSELGMMMENGIIYWHGEEVAPGMLYGPPLMDKIKQQRFDRQKEQGLHIADYKERTGRY